jgi:hypothetical protein
LYSLCFLFLFLFFTIYPFLSTSPFIIHQVCLYSCKQTLIPLHITSIKSTYLYIIHLPPPILLYPTRLHLHLIITLGDRSKQSLNYHLSLYIQNHSIYYLCLSFAILHLTWLYILHILYYFYEYLINLTPTPTYLLTHSPPPVCSVFYRSALFVVSYRDMDIIRSRIFSDSERRRSASRPLCLFSLPVLCNINNSINSETTHSQYTVSTLSY